MKREKMYNSRREMLDDVMGFLENGSAGKISSIVVYDFDSDVIVSDSMDRVMRLPSGLSGFRLLRKRLIKLLPNHPLEHAQRIELRMTGSEDNPICILIDLVENKVLFNLFNGDEDEERN